MEMKIKERPQMAYLIGAAVVWAGLIVATAVVLGGTPHFGELVSMLFVGAFYFIVIAPRGIWPTSALPGQPHSARARRGRGSIRPVLARVRERLHVFGLLGLIGLLGIPFDQPILFLFYLLFSLFAFAPRRPAEMQSRPR
jgi:hypothetical protein